MSHLCGVCVVGGHFSSLIWPELRCVHLRQDNALSHLGFCVTISVLCLCGVCDTTRTSRLTSLSPGLCELRQAAVEGGGIHRVASQSRRRAATGQGGAPQGEVKLPSFTSTGSVCGGVSGGGMASATLVLLYWFLPGRQSSSGLQRQSVCTCVCLLSIVPEGRPQGWKSPEFSILRHVGKNYHTIEVPLNSEGT